VILTFIRWIARQYDRIGLKRLRVGTLGDVVVERYMLLGYGGGYDGIGHRFPNILLHHWVDRVDDLYLHNHGRWALSIVLSGGYRENFVTLARVRSRWSVQILPPRRLHKVTDILPDTWTLFIVGPWQGETCVMTEEGTITRSQACARDSSGLTGVHRDTPELRRRIWIRRQVVARSASMRANREAI